MAEVFRAKVHGVEGFEKTIAIKRILPHFSRDAAFVDMFVREARVTVQLNHSNIVQVFELGKIGESYYIAMEFVDGRDLKSILQQSLKLGRSIPPPLAVHITAAMLSGLHHAHTARDESGRPLGIVHRDVSPHNVLVSKAGQVKVGDFGIAKLASRGHTSAGVLKGKLSYMSPEQTRTDELDARSDVFAAGVVLYEILTGRKPFQGKTDPALIQEIREKPVDPPSGIRRGLNPQLDAILARALAKNREDRYPDAATFGRDLKALNARQGILVDETEVSHLLGELFRVDQDSTDTGSEKRSGTPILPSTELDSEVSQDADTQIFASVPVPSGSGPVSTGGLQAVVESQKPTVTPTQKSAEDRTLSRADGGVRVHEEPEARGDDTMAPRPQKRFRIPPVILFPLVIVVGGGATVGLWQSGLFDGSSDATPTETVSVLPSPTPEPTTVSTATATKAATPTPRRTRKSTPRRTPTVIRTTAPATPAPTPTPEVGKTPAPASGYGHVRISLPLRQYANVTFPDGTRRSCPTQCREPIKLKSGTYRLRFTNAGYGERVVTVKVKPGVTRTVDFDWERPE